MIIISKLRSYKERIRFWKVKWIRCKSKWKTQRLIAGVSSKKSEKRLEMISKGCSCNAPKRYG